MKEYTNPAYRIASVIEEAVKNSDRTSTAAAWAVAFGLDSDKASKDPHAVLNKLQILREEVDLLESMMRETGFSTSLYGPYIDKLKRTISTPNLLAEWLGSKQLLSPETRLSIRWCAEVLPQESSVSLDELQSILDKVHALKQEIESSNLSKGIYNLLINQLSIIEKAINDYPLKGESAIKGAFRDGFSDLMSNADSIETDQDEEEIKKVGGIWSSLKKAGKEIVEADKMATAYINLIEKGHVLSSVVSNLLGGS